MRRACFILFFFLAPTAVVAQEAPAVTEAEFLAAVTAEHPISTRSTVFVGESSSRAATTSLRTSLSG
jgi:hypothetical protein